MIKIKSGLYPLLWKGTKLPCWPIIIAHKRPIVVGHHLSSPHINSSLDYSNSQSPSCSFWLPVFPDSHLSYTMLPDPPSWITFPIIPQLKHYLWFSTAYGLKSKFHNLALEAFHSSVPACMSRLTIALFLAGTVPFGKFPFVFLSRLLCSCYYISIMPFLFNPDWQNPSQPCRLVSMPTLSNGLPNLNPWQTEGSCILQSTSHIKGMEYLFF